ncbi:Rho GDP-dissociation inhibitor [Vanrija pseudolonga]|uniref:Rho GDP-dissociation inhibitor n=1 Tax=Vanrija pseudolonga TaxID=143232 RepID=A0AAF1BHA2_9TREE|nr:Rho GDP-dissociation inhibitor [Vanrija pseudolonga]
MAAPHHEDDELAPTATEGYKVGQAKTVAELANLDKEDESLQRWKASLGLGTSGGGGQKKVILKTLFLRSTTRKQGDVVLDLTQSPAELAQLKKAPITIKEGVDYSVGITFSVEGEIVSGLRYIQVVKRTGITVDRIEHMLGSYGPQPEPYTKVFAGEESPSGMLARSGSYNVRSRVVDDDGAVWLDVEWGFKLGKEW